MEKIVIGLGATTGAIAGFAFFAFWRDLPLPSLLFFLVDALGPIIASVVFGVLTSIVASFAFALLVDALWPKSEPKP
ncbi:MAG: hypothetical protein M0D54_19960 [Hyphomonadaceae bacterium JAD_PAG50586_4]|nr:MAG: hypothetical protein M0D54_19960 [Hyphomonadaceae bacterium JAD_PAG50586_4]